MDLETYRSRAMQKQATEVRQVRDQVELLRGQLKTLHEVLSRKPDFSEEDKKIVLRGFVRASVLIQILFEGTLEYQLAYEYVHKSKEVLGHELWVELYASVYDCRPAFLDLTLQREEAKDPAPRVYY